MKNSFLLLITVFIFFSCKSQQKNDELSERYPKTSKEYFILSVYSTKKYFIAESESDEDSELIVLVINKLSKQLNGKNLYANKTYNFSTYNYFDTVISGGEFCHEVEDKKVWCSTENKGLHFTDGMGNVKRIGYD